MLLSFFPKAMAVFCMKALQDEEINKVSLIAFQKNEVGNRFWKGLGWTYRDDVNYYECVLNEENVTTYNPQNYKFPKRLREADTYRN